MKELVAVPIVIAGLLGMLAELQDLSDDAQQRTLEYAQDATAALDCAYQARPLTDCSPGITNPDFSEEITRTNQLLEEAQAMR